MNSAPACRGRRIVAGIALLALAAPPASAGAQVDLAPAAPRQPYPVVLTVEGGGSLGVYEAGMTWALVEMFKRKRAVEERDPRWASRVAPGARSSLEGFPWLRLAAVTGASSGSVNAFLAATSWCDRALDERPEDSPFWRAWVTTGLTQLMPGRGRGRGRDAEAEGGIFSRRYVSESVFGWTKRYWRERDWDPECAVEFGATVTRLHAEPVPINRAIQAGNMRWASTFTVGGGYRGPRLRPRTGDQDGYRMGRVAMLPPVGDTIPVDAAIALLEASSAYPLAFEPRALAFCADAASQPGATAAAVREACGGRTGAVRGAWRAIPGRTEAQFVDGGVFDNAPLALGFGLLLRDSSLTAARFPYALYLSPDHRRRWPDGRRDGHGGREAGVTPRRPPPPARGLQTLLTLAAEAIPTARQYELQFASRLLPREVERLAQLELLRTLELREAASRERARDAEGRADAAERHGAALAGRARCLDSLLLRSRLRTDSLRQLTDSLLAQLLLERRRADSLEADTTDADTTDADSVEADTSDADTTDADTTDADTTDARLEWRSTGSDTLEPAPAPPDEPRADADADAPGCAAVDAADATAARPFASVADERPFAGGQGPRSDDPERGDDAPPPAAGPLDDYIRATGRWHPIAGEWMGGFGAFLGRPLREHDFYVGVYDALALIAHDVRCAHLGPTPQPRALRDCVRDSLRALVERPPLPLGEVAPRMLRALYATEFEVKLRPPAARTSPAADSSWVVLAAVQRALGGRMDAIHAARDHDCSASGITASLVCRNGMVEFFRELRGDAPAGRVLHARARQAACAPGARPERAADCLVERRFLRTVDDPEGSLGGLLRDLLGRMRETTPRGRGGLAPRGADAVAMFYYSTDERTRRGFDMGQSSLPGAGPWPGRPAAGRPPIVWWLLPNAAALSTRRPGLELGWELRRHLGAAPFAVAVPLRLSTGRPPSARPAAGGDGEASRLTPGLRLDLKSSAIAPWVSRLSLQGDLWMGPADWRRSVSGGVSMSVLAGKLSVSAMAVPPAYRDGRERLERRYNAPVVFGVELGDVNGMLYWITTMIRG